MAILSSDKTYVTVEKGDTLWGIAATYLGSGSKYKQLAAIKKNNIVNPDLIYVGQKIYLYSDGSTSSGTSSSSNKASVTFGLLASSDNTLFATWTWGMESKTESYKVIWSYTTIDGMEFVGDSRSIPVDEDYPAASRQSTYNIPDGATKVTFKVLPISKTEKNGEKEKTHFTAKWSDKKTYNNSTPLETPPVPLVEIKDYKLVASIDSVQVDADSIEFQVYKNDTDKVSVGNNTCSVSATDFVSFSCAVTAGNTYKVRCRAVKGGLYSDWSEFSSAVDSGPATPTEITVLKATSESSVYIEWSPSATAESYDIEYTTETRYFDGSDSTTTKTDIKSTHFEIIGLESGDEYFFRVRAVKGNIKTAWTEPKSVVIGDDPAAPTTWSSSTVVITGEPLILYWVHNSEDGSGQTYFNLELTIDGAVTNLDRPADKACDDSFIKYTPEVDDEGEITSGSCEFKTSGYTEGTKIQWRVRTAGITKNYGDWSVQRTVDIYAPATLELSVTDIDGATVETLTSFPFYIYGLAGPSTQVPTGYHLSIVSNDTYETIDSVGNPKIVSKGEEIYAKHFDISEELLVEFSANNIDLENNMSYVATCVVSMNSGLTATVSTDPFIVQWVDETFEPNAEITIDTETYVAYIKPYCEERFLVNYKVERNGTKYVTTTETVSDVYGEPVTRKQTTTDEQVYSGVDVDGNELYFCVKEEATPVTDVFLSVYRREFNGSFTEIAKNIDGALNTTVTDPHPALDYARYRIVAATKSTGAVSYYDLPGYPVACKSIVIQWDEEWSNFDVANEGVMVEPPWTGSLLRLPYNIDVSDVNSSDVTFVEYIGRSHPVSYYGTQIGQTSTWNTVIPAYDVETLYGLRRLAKWLGNVYVREPSGSGYWASVKVSFSQKHREVTIPVTINITRVEGGV